MENKLIITTSWDDGHELDFRLAALLEKYGLKGTFYVPLRNAEKPVMNVEQLKELSKNHEIGGHTVNHIYLNSLGNSDAAYEIKECKVMLENQILKKVEAFCFPGGKYAQRDIEFVREAGFLFGRTTKLLMTTNETNTFLMDTTVQAYNHSNITLTKHCLKRKYLKPIFQNGFFINSNKNFVKLTEEYLNRLLQSGGVFHLWGHSWEIDEQNLWNELEAVFKMLSEIKNAVYMNNTDCWKSLNTK